jgi:Flp pilus assembly protein protease CpaA
MDHIVATTAFLALILLAGASDLRTRRIPNALTVSGLGVALALRGATGVEPLASGLIGALIAFVPAALLVVAAAWEAATPSSSPPWVPSWVRQACRPRSS